jgi:hypothetical protein
MVSREQAQDAPSDTMRLQKKTRWPRRLTAPASRSRSNDAQAVRQTYNVLRRRNARMACRTGRRAFHGCIENTAIR